MSSYQVWLYSPDGVRRKIISDFIKLSYARRVNDLGSMSLTLSADKYPISLFPTRCRFEIWRTTNDPTTKVETNRPYREMSTQWIRYEQAREFNAGGERLIELKAYDASMLLKRRIVADYSGEAGASMTAPADDMAKSIVSANMGSGADSFGGGTTTREMPNFLVQGSLSLAPSISKAFAYREVFSVLQEIAASSDLETVYLANDVVWTGQNFEFRTFVNQRGVDRRMVGGQKPNLFSPSLGNLANVRYSEDDTDTFNFVYVGGQGQGSSRTVISAYDPTRIANDPYARNERFRDARSSSTNARLEDEGIAALRESRLKRVFSAELVETPRSIYGKDFNWGDRVTVELDKNWYNAYLEALSVDVSGGKETIQARIEVNLGDYEIETYTDPGS